MQYAYPGQANEVSLPIVAKLTGGPITSGTVNFYLKRLDTGEWFKGSDSLWYGAEQIAGVATFDPDGHWYVTLASAAWIQDLRYKLYGKESGDLHIPVQTEVVSMTPADITSIKTQIGTPANIDSGGATIADNLKKIADDNDGADFRASRDSLDVIRTRGDSAWVTGTGAAAQNAYTIDTIVRTVGDDDGGVAGDVDVADGNLFSTGEVNSTTLIEVDVAFTAGIGEDPAYLGLWGNYAGAGGHYQRVQAYNYVDSVFEEIGQLGNSSINSYHQFPVTPQQINPATGAMAFKIVHSVTSPGITSHALHIDKLIVATTNASSIATDTVAALMADTGFTEGGTMTYETLCKIMAAWIAGNWRSKSGSSTIKELLDADDAATVILEMVPKTTTPYRTITVKI